MYARPVKITGAFLAESAAVVDGMLDVRGGAFSHFVADPDRVARLNLVILVRFDAGDNARRLRVELVAPSGESQALQVEMPTDVSYDEEEVGFAYWPLWIPVETDGRYEFVVTADEGMVSLPLMVRS